MINFSPRKTVKQIEEGFDLSPKFDQNGLMPCVTTDFQTGEVLMVGYMNEEALKKTIETNQAHYYSRSRKKLWKKGETSGLTQKVGEARIDDDQDCLWLRVSIDEKASCHVGYRSCFYRSIQTSGDRVSLQFEEKEKSFDPKKVYGNSPNPTII